ncbi:MAG TPA: hydrogenase maturation protease [Candidatus Angelobacter sp.]|nr:hydrogenase maturation protease [Candidatus Angelobacter sp.]
MRRVTILVCGEPMRGDDAVGRALVDALPEATAHLADIRHVGALMPDDITDAAGPVIVVDAASGPPAGELVDLPLDALVASPAPVEIGSSHAIPLTAVLGLARAILGRPIEGRFVGVAGGAWELGAPLDAAVRRAVPLAAHHLSHWIRVLAHAPPAEATTCA